MNLQSSPLINIRPTPSFLGITTRPKIAQNSNPVLPSRSASTIDKINKELQNFIAENKRPTTTFSIGPTGTLRSSQSQSGVTIRKDVFNGLTKTTIDLPNKNGSISFDSKGTLSVVVDSKTYKLRDADLTFQGRVVSERFGNQNAKSVANATAALAGKGVKLSLGTDELGVEVKLSNSLNLNLTRDWNTRETRAQVGFKTSF
jgi:hypothetical protein